jgi:flavodoxin
MNALVVYESMFGNTAEVGEAIAASLRSHGLEVLSGPIAAVEDARLDEAHLFVIGAPTHAHGMSSKGTRKAAVEDKRYPIGRPKDPLPGMRDWLPTLPSGFGRPAAAFDTRFDKPRWMTGSAGKGIAGRLEHHGFHLLAPPESFFVNGEHRLEPGQLERAAAWGTELAELASAAAPS